MEMTTKTRHHLIAGLAGNGWTALMGIAFIPIYIARLGPEGYGLIGVYVSLTGAFAVLDLGLAQSLSKTLAQFSSDRSEINRMARTVRTLEIIYLVSAVLIFLCIYALSDVIAGYWLKPQTMQVSEVRTSLVLIGAAIAARWPISLYSGGLQGLHQHVRLNMILVTTATAQAVGSVAVLLFVSPTVNAFMWWQIAAGLMHAGLLRHSLYRTIQPTRKPSFDAVILKSVWKFAAGLTTISLLSTLITQLDKFILSKILPLADFGHYAFASAVASVLFRIASPVFNIYFPKFTQALTKGSGSLNHAYHEAAQLMTLAIVPAGLTLIAFSEPIIQLWSSDPELARSTYLLVSILTIGNVLNALLYIPYAAQLANNITKIAITQNLVALGVLVPALYWSAMHLGATGAALCWVGVNLGYLFISLPVMHRWILQHELLDWYKKDVGLAACVNLPIFFAGYWALKETSPGLISYSLIPITFAVSAGITIFALPNLRRGLFA